MMEFYVIGSKMFGEPVSLSDLACDEMHGTAVIIEKVSR